MSDSNSKRLIRDIDPDDRPREKARKFGFKVLSNSELLAIILRTGTVGHAITDVCDELFASVNNSFSMLMRKHDAQLKMIPGIGNVKAQQILAIMELVRRFAEEERSSKPCIIRSAEDIYNELKYEIGNKTQEEIWMLTLNRRHEIIGRHALTRGSATASVFDVKLCLKLAILDDASAIVLSHNHPSGNQRPSPQDDNITQALKRAAASVDLRLLDHVIVTSTGYYSYSDSGRL